MTARDLVERLELRERLAAILAEIDVLEADTDVPRTLALGLLEDVERELAAADGSPSHRRRT